MTKAGWIGVRVDAELKNRAAALAKADNRSLSSWIAKLIAAEVAKADRKKVKASQPS